MSKGSQTKTSQAEPHQDRPRQASPPRTPLENAVVICRLRRNKIARVLFSLVYLTGQNGAGFFLRIFFLLLSLCFFFLRFPPPRIYDVRPSFFTLAAECLPPGPQKEETRLTHQRWPASVGFHHQSGNIFLLINNFY